MSKTSTRIRTLGVLLLAGLLLAACRAPSPESHAPTLDLNGLYTQVAGTLIAQGQQSAATSTPAATQTPFVVTATPTETPLQPVATNTALPTAVVATSVPATGCYQAYFVADVTVPDNTQMSKGQSFTKTWRIRNNGTCTWSSDFDIVYTSGTNLASSSSIDIPKEVKPGETVDISIAMTAPNSDGTYRSSWVIKAANGYTFGVNGHANSAGVPFFALIRVGTVSSSGVRYDFAANYCSASWSSNEAGSLPCPGANSGTQGFVLVLQNPELETRNEDEPAIWPRPNHASNGFIRGVYPEFTVQNGDRFRSQVGCLKNNPNCHLQFTFSYILNGTETVLGTWNEKLEGLAKDVNIDLSSLAGKTVRFVLTVKPNNTDYAQANGFWFVPRIIKP